MPAPGLGLGLGTSFFPVGAKVRRSKASCRTNKSGEVSRGPVTGRSYSVRSSTVTLARSRVRVRAGYEFVSCRRHGDQRLRGPVTGPSTIATS